MENANHAGAFFFQLHEHIFYQNFCFIVQRRCGFVQQHQSGLFYHGMGKVQTQAFPTGECIGIQIPQRFRQTEVPQHSFRFFFCFRRIHASFQQCVHDMFSGCGTGHHVQELGNITDFIFPQEQNLSFRRCGQFHFPKGFTLVSDLTCGCQICTMNTF